MGYRGGKTCSLEECGTLVLYSDAKRLWPVAYEDVMRQIRDSGSKAAQDPAWTFRWALHRSPTTPSKAGSTVLYLDVPSVRLIAQRGRLRRISKLYSKGKVVPGLWSF